MRKLLTSGGYGLLVMAAMAASGVSICSAPTVNVRESAEVMPIEQLPTRGLDGAQLITTRNVQAETPPLEQPAQRQLPLRTVVEFRMREEDLNPYQPVKKSRCRYNRRYHRAQRNGWRC